MNSSISDKDKKDWEKFLSNDERLPNKDKDTLQKYTSKVRSYDLHGYSLEQANKNIKDLINKSYEDGVSKLIIVTGKGLHSNNEKNPYVSKDLGILKYSVPEYISNNKELMKLVNRIEDASAADGGSGSFYIYLKKLTK